MRQKNHELKIRYIHVDFEGDDTFQSATFEAPKCQFATLNCALGEIAVLNLVKTNPTIKQQELADIIGKSIRSIKRIMKSLQDKKYLRRESGKKYGRWDISV